MASRNAQRGGEIVPIKWSAVKMNEANIDKPSIIVILIVNTYMNCYTHC